MSFRKPKYKRSQKLVPIGGAMRQMLDRMDHQGGMRLARLWREWADVLGPEFSRWLKPLGHRGSTLVLASEDPAMAQEAQMIVPELLFRINEYLGKEVFDKVAFELINGRVPLDGYEAPKEETVQPPIKKPKNLGQLEGELGQGPVARCYRAYVRMIEDEK